MLSNFYVLVHYGGVTEPAFRYWMPVAELGLKLKNNHFYFILLGKLYKNIDNNKAKFNFEKANALAKTQTERQGIQARIESLS